MRISQNRRYTTINAFPYNYPPGRQQIIWLWRCNDGCTRRSLVNIEAGEFVGVMGPSGCGKSTLMNVIGLLDRPTHGEYMLRRRSVAKLRATQRAKIRRDTVGFIFQSSNLLPRMTVIDNVALPLAYKGMSTGRRASLGGQYAGARWSTGSGVLLSLAASGGQAQCVAIARALVNDPDIIIADEPTGNLDSASSRLDYGIAQ